MAKEKLHEFKLTTQEILALLYGIYLARTVKDSPHVTVSEAKKREKNEILDRLGKYFQSAIN